MNRKPAVCALAAVLLLGAMGLSDASDLLERSYISIEALSLGPGFQKVLAEEGPAETFRRAVIRDMGIPGEALESTKYSYNYMEEEDGKRGALSFSGAPGRPAPAAVPSLFWRPIKRNSGGWCRL